MGILGATCLSEYHYFLLFSRIKQTMLAGYLHSTQRVVQKVLDDERTCGCECGILILSGIQGEGSHLTWVDSFPLKAG